MSEPGTLPQVESLTPEQAAAEITAIRGNAEHDFHHEGRPGHESAMVRLEQLYRRREGGASVPGASVAPPPPKSDLQRKIEERYGIEPEAPEAPRTEPAVATPQDAAPDWSGFQRPEVPEGETWDESAEHALRALTVSHDVPVTELSEMAQEYRRAWDRREMDPKARVMAGLTQLRQAWGEHFDLKQTRATQMFAELPPRLQQHVRAVGMDMDAALMLRLYGLWERKHR